MGEESLTRAKLLCFTTTRQCWRGKYSLYIFLNSTFKNLLQNSTIKQQDAERGGILMWLTFKKLARNVFLKLIRTIWVPSGSI